MAKETANIGKLVSSAEQGGPGGVRAASRLMTLAENSQDSVVSILTELRNAPEPRIILGITGAPGTGKSRCIEYILSSFRERYPSRRVGVIAIDPSSPYTRGAILGDRVRMMKHATDPFVFIRSSASRGTYGGLSSGTLGVLKIMGLIGCDVVIVETVGVGQSEVSVKELSDLVAVVLAPGQGDSVQFSKAGLMEAGDMFIVNKSDLPGAEEYRSHIIESLGMFCGVRHVVPEEEIFQVSALKHFGIEPILDRLEVLYEQKGDLWKEERRSRENELVRRMILDRLEKEADAIFGQSFGKEILKSVLRGETDIFGAAVKISKHIVCR